MNPKFSIIIPVYNVAPYLRECLDSVLEQTFTDWEAICVDDGSTDGSEDILDDYGAKDRRFRIIHQTNAGVSVARNSALNIACGEWLGFLDSDDFYAPKLLSEISAKIDVTPDLDIIGFNPVKFSGVSKMSSGFHPKSIQLSLSGDLLDKIYASRHAFPFLWTIWDKFYRRDLIEANNIRFVEGVNIVEDRLFAEMAFASAESFIAFDTITGYWYRQRTGSLYQKKMTLSNQKAAIARVRYAEKWGIQHGRSEFLRYVANDAFMLLLPSPDLTEEERDEYLFYLFSRKACLFAILRHKRWRERLVGCLLIAFPCRLSMRIVKNVLWRRMRCKTL